MLLGLCMLLRLAQTVFTVFKLQPSPNRSRLDMRHTAPHHQPREQAAEKVQQHLRWARWRGGDRLILLKVRPERVSKRRE